ncbi:hypothetical protein CDEST_03499 [Colletotrichum destructivum]|uniref:Uncharacterized protein n=1 Tax=Colletotrichum destructivum TaxID=34406 RepID=A0AAX4I5C9_9PEZI|nr:hypothetical protein CDEST_03499 [Colletotrichum destructivum]
MPGPSSISSTFANNGSAASHFEVSQRNLEHGTHPAFAHSKAIPDVSQQVPAFEESDAYTLRVRHEATEISQGFGKYSNENGTRLVKGSEKLGLEHDLRGVGTWFDGQYPKEYDVVVITWWTS